MMNALWALNQPYKKVAEGLQVFLAIEVEADLHLSRMPNPVQLSGRRQMRI
jgi:hypothetical protein